MLSLDTMLHNYVNLHVPLNLLLVLSIVNITFICHTENINKLFYSPLERNSFQSAISFFCFIMVLNYKKDI